MLSKQPDEQRILRTILGLEVFSLVSELNCLSKNVTARRNN